MIAKLHRLYAKTYAIVTTKVNGRTCVKEIKAQKGLDSHWPKEDFRHPFSSKPILDRIRHDGFRLVKQGDVIVKGSGFKPVYGVKTSGYTMLHKFDILLSGPKPLWKFFTYSQRDIDGSRK